MIDGDELPRHLRLPRLRRKELSQYLLLRHGLRVAPATLAKLASVGGGPPFRKFGATPLYDTISADKWAIAKLGREHRSTSDVGEAA
jgi:hypothetical protein